MTSIPVSGIFWINFEQVCTDRWKSDCVEENAKSVFYLCQQRLKHFLDSESVEAIYDLNTIMRTSICLINVLFPIILKLYSRSSAHHDD